MNQRIRELAEQAKEHANSYDDAGTPIWFQFYNEKLAQLLIRECVNLVENHAQEYHQPVWAVELVNDMLEVLK